MREKKRDGQLGVRISARVLRRIEIWLSIEKLKVESKSTCLETRYTHQSSRGIHARRPRPRAIQPRRLAELEKALFLHC